MLRTIADRYLSGIPTGSLFLILSSHVVGLIGISFPVSRDFFLSLSPLNLLLSFGLVLSLHRVWTPFFAGLLVFYLLAGYGVEVLGVQTGWPFGQYHYLDALGWQWWGVPVIMGVNWALLLYATVAMAGRLVTPVWQRIALAAAGMVFIDSWIEPISVDLDFWQWSVGHAPATNFLGWFMVSALLQAPFFLFCSPTVQQEAYRNNLVPVYLVAVTLFFILLNVVL
jgi:putative membrane protein